MMENISTHSPCIASERFGSSFSHSLTGLWVGMAEGQRSKRKVASKQWSCSELKDGNQKLMAVKMETPGKAQVIKRSRNFSCVYPSGSIQYVEHV